MNQLFVYADDVYSILGNIDVIQGNTYVAEAFDEIGLETKIEKTIYLITRPNTEEEGNRNITIYNEIREKINNFKHLGGHVTKQAKVGSLKN